MEKGFLHLEQVTSESQYSLQGQATLIILNIITAYAVTVATGLRHGTIWNAKHAK
jgi:hypothetical protein